MIAAIQEQQQAAGTTPSAEEEALKRNTDCVYFLASPLTCKKGTECEYRHSEYARVNPRDCYYWLNGNCLNPKCGFRHPPLDGLFGTQVSSTAGSSLPPSNVAVPPAMHAPQNTGPQNTGKQAVPCIFFQKGLCLKGDRCAFLHGPNPTSNNKVIATSITELPPPKKPSAGLQKFTHEQKMVQRNLSKAAEVPTEAKPVSKPEIVQPRNILGVERNPTLLKSIDDELPVHKAKNLAPVVNGISSRINRFPQTQLPEDHVFQNGKDSDEFLRESSPGFDVLVDDELRNSDYPHGEDQYRRRGHEGRNLNPGDEYDAGLSADYSSVADMEQETYPDLQGYDTYDHMQGQYAWEQHRTSSERMLSGSAHIERRGYSELDSPESIEESDLRYRLSKHRRVNGLRSVVSHDFVSDNPVDKRAYQSSSRRDSHNLSSHENAASSRLRGRIKLPERPPSGSDPRVEREVDWGRNRARVSPGRSPVPSHQARVRDRVKARVEEDYISEGRHRRGARMRREMTDDRGTDFEGPKSLAELKGSKSSMEDGQIQPSLRKRKQLEDRLPFEGNLSFKGPMPLSEILKRKREAEGAASGVMTSSRSKEDNHLKDGKESFLGSSNTVSETKDSHMSAAEESDREVPKDEKLKSQLAGGAEENSEVVPLQYSSEQRNPSEPETEDGVMVDEDREYEGDEQREGDYEYDQVDEGEYYEEGEENPEGGEEEYVDEEDGEDFAKKIGVLFS